MLKPDRIEEYNGVKINEYLLTNPKNNPNHIGLPAKRTKPLIKITVHNTDDLRKVEDDAEQYTRATVNGNMKTVVPNYYVDDIGAWKLLPDEYGNWTCGGGGDSIGNSQTIAIEIIMNDNSEHDFKAEDNAAKLIAYLQRKHGLKSTDVVSHTYWIHVNAGHTNPFTHPEEISKYIDKWNNYKMCPLYILPHWNEFTFKIAKYFSELSGTKLMVIPNSSWNPPFKIRVVANELNVRNNPGTGANSKVVYRVFKNDAYTITDVIEIGVVPWGRLKSGIGWVSLLPKYVKIL